jgi:hypothetical protein
MRRRLVAVGALVAGALAGVALFHRREGARWERVNLFYDDGSLETLAGEEAKPLLDVARSALDATLA